jgi:hypothetical protein
MRTFNIHTQKPLVQTLLDRQAERKIAFLKSGRMPWSREEWRWHEETQRQASKKIPSAYGEEVCA